MNLTEMKKYAYEQAYIEDSITSIRHCGKKGDSATGYLIVNSTASETPKKSAFMVIYLGPTAVIEVTPKEYKQLLDKKRKLPEGWVLKEMLFDGTFVFDNLAVLLASLKEWPYFVAIEAQRKSGILEFVCKSGHRWQLKLPGYNKKSHFLKILLMCL